MKFVKLHHDGREVLVNMSAVTDVYKNSEHKSVLYFNFEAGGEQVHIYVDETLDEIYEKVSGTV